MRKKLATPDVAVADLIGEVDPIKVAEGRYLADEETIHYGLIPRTNRGIFAINELPDLTEKVQVGLFNLMEEKDVQIKGFKIRLPVDVVFVASANPEDYTSRGRIITPLKDRFDIQIRTHYPRTIEHEIAIMEQEVAHPPWSGVDVRIPQFMKDILAQVTFEARASNEINQSSGVSVRVTINNFESAISNAEKRAVRNSENEIVPRISDLHSLYASTAGKIELEYVGEDKKEDDLIERLINRAVLKVFDKYLKLDDLKKVSSYFEQGWGVEVGQRAVVGIYGAAAARLDRAARSDHAVGTVRNAGADGCRERVYFRGFICIRSSTRIARAGASPTTHDAQGHGRSSYSLRSGTARSGSSSTLTRCSRSWPSTCRALTTCARRWTG